MEVIGFRRGAAAGPVNVNPDDLSEDWRWVMRLNKAVVRKIDRSGGTFPHTSRTRLRTPGWANCRPSREQYTSPDPRTGLIDLTPHVLRVLAHLKIDGLRRSAATTRSATPPACTRSSSPWWRFRRRWTTTCTAMDYCIGFKHRRTRSVDLITACAPRLVRTSASSSSHSSQPGEMSLFAAPAGALIGRSSRRCRSTSSSAPSCSSTTANPSNYAVPTISEGATTTGGDWPRPVRRTPCHRKLGGIGEITAEMIKKVSRRTHHLSATGRYLMRSGA